MFWANKNKWNFFKSFKFRLILMIIVLSVIPGVVLRFGILHFYEWRAVSIRESEIMSQARILTNMIATSEYMQGESNDSSTIETQINLLTTIYEGRVIIVDKACRIIQDTYNLDSNKTITSSEVMRCFLNQEEVNYDGENHFIEMAFPIKTPEDVNGTVLGVLLVSASTDNIQLNLVYLRQISLILEVVIGSIIMFLGILGVHLQMKPFKRLAEQIGEVKDGFGTDKVEVNDYIETKRIGDKINALIAHMKVINDSRQEFVSNVSHELKTPMTSMKVLADSINSMQDAPKELYQEFMVDVANEIERETKIINDLLSLVKMDKAAADLNIASVNINELVEQIIKRLQPIADKQKVEIVLESFRPVTAEVDEVKLSLVITNLIENAIKYNRSDGEGWVHVSLNADHQYFYLKVEDTGIGIPEESLDHIYERFYRADKSHSREIGGTGLGLAIARNSVLMHRGAIKAHSILGEGTTFDVRIPLNYMV